MASGFRRSRDRYVAELSDAERDVIVSFLEQTAELLEAAAPPMPTEQSASPDPFEDLMRRAGWSPGVDPRSPESFESRDAGAVPSAPSPDDLGGAPPTAAWSTGPIEEDPAVRRLLPDAHRDDPALAEQFRRLSGDNVRHRKLTTLSAAVAALRAGASGQVSLTNEEAHAVLVALTDVRLVLAERLDIHTDDDAEHLEAQLAALAEDDDRAQAMLVYDFLTWLQETLASSLLG